MRKDSSYFLKHIARVAPPRPPPPPDKSNLQDPAVGKAAKKSKNEYYKNYSEEYLTPTFADYYSFPKIANFHDEILNDDSDEYRITQSKQEEQEKQSKKAEDREVFTILL